MGGGGAQMIRGLEQSPEGGLGGTAVQVPEKSSSRGWHLRRSETAAACAWAGAWWQGGSMFEDQGGGQGGCSDLRGRELWEPQSAGSGEAWVTS